MSSRKPSAEEIARINAEHLLSTPLKPADLEKMLLPLLNRVQKEKFETLQSVDFGYGVAGVARFRANVYMQRGTVGGFGDVTGDGDQPRGRQLSGRCLEVVRAPGVGHDRPAPVQQGRDDCAAEAPRAAGDDRDGRDVFGRSHTRHTGS